ncbi:carbohydrate kinase family protein [Treponema primitia]|uniref:carbohydrate kinase family protein n=1 Tax=Treponema primitia TaxID=88058 RepID=UPI0039807147
MIIHGTGCCVIDFLYPSIDFTAPSFQQALSRKDGDGGLSPGRLVFAEDFERFMGKPYETALRDISGGIPPASRSLGGPSVVSLTHAAQVLREKAQVCFFGIRGSDETGELVDASLSRLPFREYRLLKKPAAAPRTDVFSDPHYDNGHGERTFINLLGAARNFDPTDLGDNFFDADIIAFGGTALTPSIHDGLTGLLKRARENGAVTVVNLVYDYRSEINTPGRKWKLGTGDDAYPSIDVLIADRDEALKTSGCSSSEDATAWFLSRGTGAVLITEGARSIRIAAGKGVCNPLETQTLPVCEEVNRELADFPERRGDTTGCGDNFAGGIIAGIAEQLALAPRGKIDLREACILGTAAGGFACFTVGGVFYETYPGEKRERLAPYIASYRKQISGLL